jgi:hypothetical protein
LALVGSTLDMKRYTNIQPLGFAKAVANCTAAYDLITATFETPLRPAARVFCDAADKHLEAIAQGNMVEYLELDEPGVFGLVLDCFEGHEFRADMNGVSGWHEVKPARLPGTFVRRAQQKRCRALVMRNTELGQWRTVRPWAHKLAHLAKKELITN